MITIIDKEKKKAKGICKKKDLKEKLKEVWGVING